MTCRPVFDMEVTVRSHRISPGLLAGLLTLLVALFAAAPAMAGTVTNAFGVVSFSDDSNTDNALTFSDVGGRLRVRDASAPVDSVACQPVSRDSHAVGC